MCIDVWTHWKCAVWASGVYFDGDELKGLSEAIEEGQSLVSLSLLYSVSLLSLSPPSLSLPPLSLSLPPLSLSPLSLSPPSLSLP